MQPRILIATTTWWAMPARLALAFAQSGAHVGAILPRGHPLTTVHSLEGQTRYSPRFPLSSLKRAIETTRPGIIVPCDDRVVEHMHQLYALNSTPNGDYSICSLIERSLGEPANYPITASRSKHLGVAQRAGIRVPQTAPILRLDDLKSWLQEYGFPSVLKMDGTWGGSGVRVVRSWEEAKRAFEDLNRPVSFSSLITHLSFHDLYAIFPWRTNGNHELTIQSHVDGSSATVMFACWEGRVIESLCVDVLYSQEKLGASTIVRTCSNPDIERAGQILAERLGISGFFGLDFILEAKTGTPYLIELNPRATQIGHLQPTGGASLVNAMYDHLTGQPATKGTRKMGETIAFFPQSIQRSVNSPILAQNDVRYDVPWEEPALIRELMRRPWNSRHLSAWIFVALQRTLNGLSQLTRRPKKKLASSNPRA